MLALLEVVIGLLCLPLYYNNPLRRAQGVAGNCNITSPTDQIGTCSTSIEGIAEGIPTIQGLLHESLRALRTLYIEFYRDLLLTMPAPLVTAAPGAPTVVRVACGGMVVTVDVRTEDISHTKTNDERTSGIYAVMNVMMMSMTSSVCVCCHRT